jgi:hypothetical protein
MLFRGGKTLFSFVICDLPSRTILVYSQSSNFFHHSPTDRLHCRRVLTFDLFQFESGHMKVAESLQTNYHRRHQLQEIGLWASSFFKENHQSTCL